MKKKTKIFFVLSLILFILFIWGRTETQGDRGYSVYHMVNAVTESGKIIPLGWEFKVPTGDPVISFKITIEGKKEKASLGETGMVVANR